MRALFFLAPVLGLLGCGLDCNLMWAPDNLSIEFDPEVSTPGVWTFELSGDHEASCEVELPVPDPSDMAYTPCDADTLSLQLSGDGADVGGLYLDNVAPSMLTLAVYYNATLVYEDVLEPSYVVDEPNGQGCGERYSGQVTVSVPEP